MLLLKAILLGIIQGLCEFLPVSSSGHLALANSLFALPEEVDDLALNVLLHLGTLAAVILADLLIFKVSSDIIIGVTLAILGVGLLIFLENLVDKLINYKTAGVAIDGDKITLYNGGLAKSVTTIHAKHLVAIENVTTPKRQKKGITTLILHLRTNALTNEVRVDIQSAELVERLEGMLVL